MINNLYNLPDINFIGGDFFPVTFTLYKDDAQTVPFELDDGMSAYFSIIHYANREYSSPVLSLSTHDVDGSITFHSSDDGYDHLLTVKIPPKKTVGLYGKYIYQVTLIGEDGIPEILGQGIMNITRNIDTKIFNY